MVRIQFETGQEVEFEGDPTQADIEEVAVKLGIQQTSEEKPVSGNVGTSLLKGIGKGLASTAVGLGRFGETFARQTAGRVLNLAAGNGFNAPTQTATPEFFTAGTEAAQKLDEKLAPQGTAESIGFATEKIAEFLLPSGGVTKAVGATNKAIKGTSALAKGSRLGARTGIEVATNVGVSGLQQGGFDNDETKTAAIVSALFPAASAVTGTIVKSAGQKIQQSVIKPSLADVRDGFRIENISKYNIGGNLQQVLAKTNVRMNKLSEQLKAKLGESTVPVNLNKVYENTVARLGGNKALNFGDLGGTNRILESLKGEIAEVAGPNGLVDLAEAQLIKRGAGTKGAWVYGAVDPDSRAVEKVYSTFYNEIKTAIEKAAPAGVKEINKQLSDLIPINNAVIRRIPIAERNNAISLTDGLALFGTIFDPRSLAFYGVNKLSKSGRFANILLRASDIASESKNPVVKRILGN